MTRGLKPCVMGSKEALQLLGYPVPDYAQRDQEWEEENQPWDEPERQEDQ